MFKDSPIFGAGPDTFWFLGYDYRTVKEALLDRSVFPDQPHSVFVWFMTSAGLIGVIGFCALIGWMLWTGWKHSRDNIVGAAFFGAAVAYLAQAFVSIDVVPLRVAGWAIVGGLAATAFGVPEVAWSPKNNKKKNGKSKQPAKKTKKNSRAAGYPQRPAWAKAGAAGALLLALPAVWWPARLLVADYQMRRGMDALINQRLDEGFQHYERALSFRDNTNYRSQFGIMLRDHSDKVPAQDERERLLQLAVDEYSFYADLPDPNAANNLATIYETWARYDETKYEDARAAYQRALDLDPLNPVLRVNLANLLVNGGENDEALEVLRPSIQMVEDPPAGVPDGSPDVWGTYALILALQGEQAEAEEKIEIALNLDPGEKHALLAQEVLSSRG
jgi:tetratricopeptide (TPR) repeat protein